MLSRPPSIRTVVSLLLMLVTVLVYLPVRHYDFTNYDDDLYVTENPVVQAGLTWTGVKWAFTTMAASNWHPLTWLSLMLDCQIFGLDPGWAHLINVYFHAANAALLFLLLLRLTNAFWQSALVAALFAWHPLHVESVAWVAERKDVLSAFFGLLTLLAYVRYAQGRGLLTGKNETLKTGSGFYGLALLLFALGLMAKPMLVTLPFAMLLLDYWPLQRVPDFEWRWSHWSRLIWEKWPFFILAAGSGIVTFIAQRNGEAVAPLEAYPLSVRICNSVVAYAKYLFKALYPMDLAVVYPLSREIPWGQVVGAVVVLAIISWGAWRMRRSKPYWLMGWLWYLGMLLPVIGLVQVGPQALADRYSYMPLIGVFIAVTFGLRDLVAYLQLKPVVPVSVAVLTLGVCLGVTAWQLHFWESSETLFERALAVTRNNPTAENDLGFVLIQKGHPREALEHFEKALQLEPSDALVHDNLALALQTLGHSPEAMEHFQEAARLAPNNAKIQDNWAVALLQTGQLEEATQHFQEALCLNPDNAQAHNNLGILLDKTGHPQEAIEHFRRALQLQPVFPKAYYNLALTLVKVDQLPEAIENFRQALRLQPNFPNAYNSLGRALLANGQTYEAIAQFRMALQLRPDFVEARKNLGNALLRSGYALFQNGQIPQAVACLQEGLQIHPNDLVARNYLGFAMLRQGQAGPAEANFRKVLDLQPGNVDARKYLAWILATCPDASLRNGTQAVELAQQANRLSGGNNPAILAALAAAQAEDGRFPDAVSTAQEALVLATTQTNGAVADALRVQIKSYQAGSPFRDGSLTNTPATNE